MPDDMRTDRFARLNHKRETPVLVKADGTLLSESMAIALHLESRDGERHISFARGNQSDRLHERMAFLATSFFASFSPLWKAFEMKPDPPVQEALRTYGRESVAKRHRQLEAMLGDSPFMLGDRPTLADALFIGIARWADFHKAIDPGAFPRVGRLKERVEATPAFRYALAIEEGGPAPASEHFRGHVDLNSIAVPAG
jgi:glutathione S-transferase